VVGEKERTEQTVNVRTRDNQVHGMHKLSHVLDVMLQEKNTRSAVSLFGDGGGHGEATVDGA
jgi:threonyl-tRNA synthetase